MSWRGHATSQDEDHYHDSEPVEINQDLPHLRNGGEWKDPKTKRRAESYLGWLKALKMSDADAQCLIGDIYWDCLKELTLAEHGLLQATLRIRRNEETQL